MAASSPETFWVRRAALSMYGPPSSDFALASEEDEIGVAVAQKLLTELLHGEELGPAVGDHPAEAWVLMRIALLGRHVGAHRDAT